MDISNSWQQTRRIISAILSRLMETVRGKGMRTNNLKVRLLSGFTTHDVIQQMEDQRRSGSLALISWDKILLSVTNIHFCELWGLGLFNFYYLNPLRHSHWKHYVQPILEHYVDVKSMLHKQNQI